MSDLDAGLLEDESGSGDEYVDAGTGELLSAADVQAHIEVPETYFVDTFAFVEEFLATAYGRHVRDQDTGFRWCAKWWEHPEAFACPVSRILDRFGHFGVGDEASVERV